MVRQDQEDHVVKATVVADASRRPLWVEANPSGEGLTNDIAMLGAQSGLMMVLADRGYPTLGQDLGDGGVITPVYANRYHQVSGVDRVFNRALSSMRMPVEHACGRMKWWRALQYWRRPPAAFDRTTKAIGVLATLT